MVSITSPRDDPYHGHWPTEGPPPANASVVNDQIERLITEMAAGREAGERADERRREDEVEWRDEMRRRHDEEQAAARQSDEFRKQQEREKKRQQAVGKAANAAKNAVAGTAAQIGAVAARSQIVGWQFFLLFALLQGAHMLKYAFGYDLQQTWMIDVGLAFLFYPAFGMAVFPILALEMVIRPGFSNLLAGNGLSLSVLYMGLFIIVVHRLVREGWNLKNVLLLISIFTLPAFLYTTVFNLNLGLASGMLSFAAMDTTSGIGYVLQNILLNPLIVSWWTFYLVLVHNRETKIFPILLKLAYISFLITAVHVWTGVSIFPFELPSANDSLPEQAAAARDLVAGVQAKTDGLSRQGVFGQAASVFIGFPSTLISVTTGGLADQIFRGAGPYAQTPYEEQPKRGLVLGDLYGTRGHLASSVAFPDQTFRPGETVQVSAALSEETPVLQPIRFTNIECYVKLPNGGITYGRPDVATPFTYLPNEPRLLGCTFPSLPEGTHTVTFEATFVASSQSTYPTIITDLQRLRALSRTGALNQNVESSQALQERALKQLCGFGPKAGDTPEQAEKKRKQLELYKNPVTDAEPLNAPAWINIILPLTPVPVVDSSTEFCTRNPGDCPLPASVFSLDPTFRGDITGIRRMDVALPPGLAFQTSSTVIGEDGDEIIPNAACGFTEQYIIDSAVRFSVMDAYTTTVDESTFNHLSFAFIEGKTQEIFSLSSKQAGDSAVSAGIPVRTDVDFRGRSYAVTWDSVSTGAEGLTVNSQPLRSLPVASTYSLRIPHERLTEGGAVVDKNIYADDPQGYRFLCMLNVTDASRALTGPACVSATVLSSADYEYTLTTDIHGITVKALSRGGLA